MSEQHSAVIFLLAAHERAAALAAAAIEPDPGLHPPQPVEFILANQEVTTRATEAAERFIRANTPADVLRRVTAEREILAEHASDYGDCKTCDTGTGDFSERGYQWRDVQSWPCRTVLGLAKAWGWEAATDG